MSADSRRKVCLSIADDMRADASDFDGRPFNGRTVAEYFGNQGAAIAALARVVESLLAEGEAEKAERAARVPMEAEAIR